MKRVLAVLVGAGIAVGGGVAAWAGPGGGGGANREAAKACLAQARKDHPDADKAALKEAVKACLAAQGITAGSRRQLTPEQTAKRDALAACLKDVKAKNPDAGKAQLRELAGPCLEQAGIQPGQIRTKLAAAKACLDKVRAANPTAARAELRRLVKECVQAGPSS